MRHDPSEYRKLETLVSSKNEDRVSDKNRTLIIDKFT